RLLSVSLRGELSLRRTRTPPGDTAVAHQQLLDEGSRLRMPEYAYPNDLGRQPGAVRAALGVSRYERRELEHRERRACLRRLRRRDRLHEWHHARSTALTVQGRLRRPSPL